MTKQTILTGIRANNDLHIGNFFGAMLPIIDMAKQRSSEFNINLFIPDLHSFTTPIDHDQLFDSIMHNARVFAAAGLPLDDDAIQLYRQSYIPAHSELTWILDCFTGFGEMRRMTQFKDKSGLLDEFETMNFLKEILDGQKADDSFLVTRTKIMDLFNIQLAKETSVGLFTYPVLMASDILLYEASYIPVGEDQSQHLEFTRDIAERMNKRFGELFIVPEPVKKQHEFFGNDQGLRIKDLVDPTKKMSKSDETGKGVIFLSDDPEVAAKKIMSATTDDRREINYDKSTQPGVSNLLEILTLLRQANDPENKATLESTTAEFQGQSRYGDFKKIVADETVQFLRSFQAELANVDDEAINAKLITSEKAMNEVANKTLHRVQQAVGLRAKG